MNYTFGSSSNGKLSTCCPEIRLLANRALHLSPYDFTIIWGWRGEDIQNALLASRASTKKFPDSKHNIMSNEGEPNSEALDFGPWIDNGIPWKETHTFALIAGCFFAAGKEQGIHVRWGGDWNTNGKKDQTLLDYGHIEVIL